MSSDVVLFGVISTARIALDRHIPAAMESTNSEIVAISSRQSSTARSAAEKYGIPTWYGSYEAMLEDARLEAVINPLPNSMHCEWTVKAAEAGKHVLCEKPLAVTIHEAQRMIHAARLNNVLLVEAFTHRWNPHLRGARKLISEGVIGHVTSLYSDLTFPVSDPQGNIRFSPDLAGGSLMDVGCYTVYACRFVLNEEPVRAVAFTYDSGGYGIDTTFNGMLEFPQGAVAHLSSSMEEQRRCGLIVIGSEGHIEIPDMFDDSGPLIVKTADGESVRAVSAPDRYLVQLEEFSNCVLTGEPPKFPAEDGLSNTAVLVALGTSAKKGVVVDVERVV